MDALLIHGPDVEPSDARVALETQSDLADHVLDERWVVEGLHCDVALVGPLKKRVDGSRSRSLGNRDDFLDPYECFAAVRLFYASGLNGDVATLIVCSVVAYRLTTRAETCHWNLYPKNEVVDLVH